MKRIRLDALVRERHQLSWAKARDYIESRKIWIGGAPVTDPGFQVDEGSDFELKMNAPREAPETRAAKSATLSRDQVVYEDSQLIVVNKPSGLSTVPFEDQVPDNLETRVSRYLKQPKIHVVHRLDRETSGLLVFARTLEASKALANQFRFHTVLRRYLALAHGDVESQTFRSLLVENRGDGLRGSTRRHDPEAKEAITHVNALERFDGFTLIECRLETGRTHQIRIHLSEAGHPLLGERLYVREFEGSRIEAPRVMLHAMELGFMHPTKNIVMLWEAAPPADFGLTTRAK